MLKRIVIAAVVVAALGFYWVSWGLDHVLIREAVSPSRTFVAFVHGREEGYDPPYGESVDLVRSWVPFPRHFAYTVFSGYRYRRRRTESADLGGVRRQSRAKSRERAAQSSGGPDTACQRCLPGEMSG